MLADGLLQLCHNNPTVNDLITPRRDAILTLLTGYIDQIELFNPALSLVGTHKREDLITRHILDSLAPLALLLQLRQGTDNYTSVADVGSGAGLPGIPLAIVLPHLRFTLIERKGRRAGFLRNTLVTLGLSNVTVEEAEMEKAGRNRFGLVTFRAFRPLEPKILKALFRLCADGGVLAAYKGRREKAAEEMASLEKQQPDIAGRWTLTPCPVPFLDEERHLLVIHSGSGEWGCCQ